jgi:hypothetical protein
MSFSRGNDGRGGASRQRGRSRILEMSGWLFADMLLALAVVFLVVQDTTGPDRTSAQSGASPTVEIRPHSDARFDVKGGEFRWSSNQGPAVIEIEFDQQVREFDQPAAGERRGDIRFSEDTPEGWYVARLERDQQAEGFVFRAELNVPENYRPGKVSVFIPQGAALAGEMPNLRSPVFSFQALPRPEEQIDTKRGVSLVLNEPSVCAIDARGGANRVAKRIEGATSFDVGPPSGEDRKTQAESLTEWISREFPGSARVGFLFVYGSAQTRTGGARQWSPCVIQALVDLEYLVNDLSVPLLEKVPVKHLYEDALKDNQIRLEMYFFTAVTD